MVCLKSKAGCHPDADTTYRRQLTISERKDYIRAVKCLHRKPGVYGDIVPSSVSLFEDWATAHKLQTPYIHWEV
jgi:tyrosinase